MPKVSSRGHAINYLVAGAGPALLLVPGLSGWAAQWFDLGYAEVLREHYQVIAVDVLGHGESAKPHDPDAYDPHGLADDLIAVLDAEGIGAVSAWGFSLGAMLASDLVSAAPDRVRSVVLASGVETEQLDWKVLADVLRAPNGLDAFWESAGYTDPAEVADGKRRTDVEALACLCEARAPWRPEHPIPTNVPVLAYWGSAEPLAAIAPSLFDPLDVESFVLPGKDHYGAFVSVEAALLHVLPFLKRTSI